MQNPRRILHAPHNLSEAVADRVTTFSGSWTFLGLHAVWWTVWIVLHVEGFPYGLLTMLLSLEAIVLNTLVLMSQARESRKNQRRDDHEAETVDLHYVMTSEVRDMNRTQLDILENQNETLDVLHGILNELRSHRE